MIIAKGILTIDTIYNATGSFQFVERSNGITFETGADFSYDGGTPEPAFGLFNGIPVSGNQDHHALMQQHRILTINPTGKVTGVQSSQEPIPHGVLAFSHVILWCYRFPTLLGGGEIQAQ